MFFQIGHDYETVKNDLNCCIDVLKNDGTILCDDYDLTYAPGVKQAIDEFAKLNKITTKVLFNRFVKIEKKHNETKINYKVLND